MMLKNTILILASAALLVGCSEGDSTSDYDPTWGDGVTLPGGKGDFIDLAPELTFENSQSGKVDSGEIDVLKIALTHGDKFQMVKTVTSGDLAPDFTLFEGTSDPVRSDTFDVSSDKLVKNYTAPFTGTYLIAVRAFREQGTGGYTITAKCTGGPCNGEFPDPADVEMSVDDIGTCVWEARECAFAALPAKNGRVGEATARKMFTECLQGLGTEDGLGCSTACEQEVDGDTMEWTCNDIIKGLPFYADQSAECHEVTTSCMDECQDGDDYSWDDELYATSINMCWSDGFNGNCDSFARKMPECGGNVTHETAVCFETCWASPFGVWNDDLDSGCYEECGICGVECTRQIEGSVDVPSDGLVGDITDLFVGEVDPVVVGDACVMFVTVYSEEDGEFPPGVYGLVEADDVDCAASRFDRDWGAAVHVLASALEEITDADTIDALQSMDATARYFNLTGDVERIDPY